MKIELPGNPIPLKRARAGKHGFYDPQFLVKQNIIAYVKQQLPDNFKPFEGPVFLAIQFEFEMPKSWSKKKRANFYKKPHISRPDLSNLLKLYEDALNGVLWIDDSIIYSEAMQKRWAQEGSTLLYIDEVIDPDLMQPTQYSYDLQEL